MPVDMTNHQLFHAVPDTSASWCRPKKGRTDHTHSKGDWEIKGVICCFIDDYEVMSGFISMSFRSSPHEPSTMHRVSERIKKLSIHFSNENLLRST